MVSGQLPQFLPVHKYVWIHTSSLRRITPLSRFPLQMVWERDDESDHVSHDHFPPSGLSLGLK